MEYSVYVLLRSIVLYSVEGSGRKDSKIDSVHVSSAFAFGGAVALITPHRCSRLVLVCYWLLGPMKSGFGGRESVRRTDERDRSKAVQIDTYLPTYLPTYRR
jgi:hypothetical protein